MLGCFLICFVISLYIAGHYQDTHHKCPSCMKGVHNKATKCPRCLSSVPVIENGTGCRASAGCLVVLLALFLLSPLLIIVLAA